MEKFFNIHFNLLKYFDILNDFDEISWYSERNFLAPKISDVTLCDIERPPQPHTIGRQRAVCGCQILFLSIHNIKIFILPTRYQVSHPTKTIISRYLIHIINKINKINIIYPTKTIISRYLSYQDDNIKYLSC